MAAKVTIFLCFALAAGAQDVSSYTIQKEQALGASLAQDVRRQSTPFENPEAQAYVERMGARLIAALPTDAPPFTYHWELIQDQASYLEPMGFPGGYVILPSSLFLDAQNESEFAGVLAHTLAHIYLRHGTRRGAGAQFASYATIPMIFLGSWSGYGARQDASLAIPLGMLRFQQEFEHDADQEAIQMLAAAGFDPHGLASYIERMQTEPQGNTARMLSRFPPKAERVAAIEQAIAAQPPGFAAVQEEVRQTQPPPPPPERRPTLKRPGDNQ